MCAFKRSYLLLRTNEKLIIMSKENSKIPVENLEKEIRCKDSIIDQLLLFKISTQRNCHPQTEVSEDHEGVVSMV